MMTIITLVSILQVMAISLGTGCSTLAIINFFVAIADGKIDETERKMMGVVYVVLRVAMVLILITTLSLVAFEANALGGFSLLPAFTLILLIPLAVLFINATLMTMHIMPTTFGPALQAGSWYTLGTLTALESLGIVHFTLFQFLMAYITWLVLAISLVNGTMSWIKMNRHGFIKK